MHQQNASLPGVGRQCRDRDSVDRVGCLRLAFGLVHCRIGSRIDNQVGRAGGQQQRQGVGTGQVGVFPSPGRNLGQRQQRPPQFLPHLTIGTDQQNLHTPYCTFVQLRYAPLVTSATHCGLSRYHRTVLRMPDSKVSAGFHPSSRSSLRASMA
ncbi:hypothetical protein D3C72_1365370 [compost metagenome]